VPNEQVLLILWLILSYLAIFIGWRFPGHYHLAVLPPLSILAGQAFSRFVAEQRRSPQPHWRWIRAGIIAAAALPAIGFLIEDLGDVSGRLGSAPPGPHHRHVNGGPVLGGASHDAISRASCFPRGISRGERDQWQNNLSSALTPESKQRA